ncbi:MAG: Hsp20/alpha crystallin family protein [Alphaproteobacteria bacterium]|jgi:HSP20 family protein
MIKLLSLFLFVAISAPAIGFATDSLKPVINITPDDVVKENTKESKEPSKNEVKWYRANDRLKDPIDDILNDEFFYSSFPFRGSYYGDITKINILEEESFYLFQFAIPGFEKNELSLSLEKENLVLTANRKQEEKKRDKTFHRQEFFSNSIKKIVSLPEDADENSLSAEYKNGILEVKVGKVKTPVSKARLIEIK